MDNKPCSGSRYILVSTKSPLLLPSPHAFYAECSFGYDQGMMSGVNTSPDYVRRMGLGFSTYAGNELILCMDKFNLEFAF